METLNPARILRMGLFATCLESREVDFRKCIRVDLQILPEEELIQNLKPMIIIRFHYGLEMDYAMMPAPSLVIFYPEGSPRARMLQGTMWELEVQLVILENSFFSMAMNPMIYLTERRTWLRANGIISYLFEIIKGSKLTLMVKRKFQVIWILPIPDLIISLLEGVMMVSQIFREELMRLLFLIGAYQPLRLRPFMKLQKLYQYPILHH